MWRGGLGLSGGQPFALRETIRPAKPERSARFRIGPAADSTPAADSVALTGFLSSHKLFPRVNQMLDSGSTHLDRRDRLRLESRVSRRWEEAPRRARFERHGGLTPGAAVERRPVTACAMLVPVVLPDERRVAEAGVVAGGLLAYLTTAPRRTVTVLRERPFPLQVVCQVAVHRTPGRAVGGRQHDTARGGEREGQHKTGLQRSLRAGD